MNWKLKTFDELTANELYEILKLREDIFIVEQNCVYHDLDSKDKVSHHLFAEDDGQVVAYLRILPRGVKYPEVSIGRVVTKETHRRFGLGVQMLERAQQFIKESLGETEIRISAQAHLQGFYGSVGFKTQSDIYLEDGIDHVEMFCQM